MCLQCRRPGFDPWVGKIPWRRTWQPTPVFVYRKSRGQCSLVGYHPWGRKESDTTEQLHLCNGYKCIFSRVSQYIINLYVTKSATLLVEQHYLYPPTGSPLIFTAPGSYKILHYHTTQWNPCHIPCSGWKNRQPYFEEDRLSSMCLPRIVLVSAKHQENSKYRSFLSLAYIWGIHFLFKRCFRVI